MVLWRQDFCRQVILFLGRKIMISERYVIRFLNSLADTNSKVTVASAEKQLQDIWTAEKIDFLDPEGNPIHGATHLLRALGRPFKLRAVFELACGESENDAAGGSRKTAPDDPLPVTDPGPHTQAVDPLLERVISALDTQERRRDFVWAGFVVKDLLPGLGLESHEAQRWFDTLVDDEIFVLDQRPNPNNPDFPSTNVRLNRDNDVVKRVLDRNGRSLGGFKPVEIRGEPASTTLIRERR
ncbi:MAG: hypothetical protein PVI86_15500 [Phycisphaerae bacterium]|jgi:hypothetical protein